MVSSLKSVEPSFDTMACLDRLVPLLLLSLLPWDSGQQFRANDTMYLINRRGNIVIKDPVDIQLGQDVIDPKDFDLECNSTQDCRGTNVTCVDDWCECDEGYHFQIANNLQICASCPGVHESCITDQCCYPQSILRCHLDVCQCRTDLWVTPPECSSMDQFKLATQIALGSAIVLAIACLLAILWRTCKRNGREQPRRHHQDQRTGCIRRDVMRRRSSSVSITSGQLFVAELMRHRPPGYYDRSHILIEKPPTYEETVEQPLRYPLINISNLSLPQPGNEPSPQLPTHEDSACSTPDTIDRSISIGIINPVFLASDEKDDPCDTIDEQRMTELHM